MKSMLLIALSFVVGGTLILGIANFSINVSESSNISKLDYMSIRNLETIVEIVKFDLYHIGSNTDTSQAEIEDFQLNRLQFRTDVDMSLTNSIPGRVRIREIDSTNQFERTVWNITNPLSPVELTTESTTIEGLDTLSFIYFDTIGDTVVPGVGSASDIRSIEVTIISRLPNAYERDNYDPYLARKFWKSELYPKNLYND